MDQPIYLPVLIQKPNKDSTTLNFLDAKPAIISECERNGYLPIFHEITFNDLNTLSLKKKAIYLVLGYSSAFLKAALSIFEERHLHCIVVGLDVSSDHCSCLYYDRGKSVRLLLDYFRQCGKKKTALFGINPLSVSDITRERMFLSYLGDRAKDHIYYTSGSLRSLAEEFDFSLYDSAICTNDIAASILLAEANRRGVDLNGFFVAGSGNTSLARHTNPPLTTLVIDYREMGKLAVKVYKFIIKQNFDAFVRLELSEQMIIRESTGNIPYVPSFKARTRINNYESDLFMSDEDVIRVDHLEYMLSHCDETDIALLHQLQIGATRETAAENIHLGISTIRYRIGKLCAMAHVENKKQLLELLDAYHLVL